MKSVDPRPPLWGFFRESLSAQSFWEPHLVFADVIISRDITVGCHIGNYNLSWHPAVMSRFPVSSLKGSEWPKPQCRGAQLMLRSSRKGQKQITWSGPQSWLVCLRQTCWTLWVYSWGPEISARPATGSAILVAMSQNKHNIHNYYFSYHLINFSNVID